MVGVVTRNPSELRWPEFDRGFYEVKSVSGRVVEPVPDAVNMFSCFGDNAAAAADPELMPMAPGGERASADRPYFDWSYICPSREDYRRGLLEMIEQTGDIADDIRLDDVGFPRHEYCHCPACEEAFAESECNDRDVWRAGVTTAFVEAATHRVPGQLYLTLHPDPYPGHLLERNGIDLEALEPLVDTFVVPLYDRAYSTTYWLEVIADGFRSRLDSPFIVELYAVDPDIDRLNAATAVVEAYASSVCYGYDAGRARAAIRRRRANARDGVVHGESERDG